MNLIYIFLTVCFCLATCCVAEVDGSLKPTLVLAELYKLLGINDASARDCVKDSDATERLFNDFSTDVKNKDYEGALRDLNGALSSLRTAMSDCHLEEVKLKLDALAAATKFGQVSIFL